MSSVRNGDGRRHCGDRVRRENRQVPSLSLVAFLASLVILAAGRVEAQDINVVGNVTLTLSTGIPGGQPLPVQDAGARLRFRRQTVVTKITVATVCPNQHFALAVLATGLTHGVAAPEVTLIDGMPERDFVRDIPARVGGSPQAECALRYTASATYAQGNSLELGPDVHTVRYTLIAQ